MPKNIILSSVLLSFAMAGSLLAKEELPTSPGGGVSGSSTPGSTATNIPPAAQNTLNSASQKAATAAAKDFGKQRSNACNSRGPQPQNCD